LHKAEGFFSRHLDLSCRMQEFMILPIGANTFKEALQIGESGMQS
jgi:enolase